MATSGSANFVVTRDDIIQEALEQCGVLSAEETPSTDDLTSCTRTLNMMVKSWQGRGLNVFRLTRSALFLDKDQNDFILGGSSSNRWGYNFGFDAVNGAVSSGAGSITVDDASSMANGDNIGIFQSDDTMHWTTINGAPAGNVVTLTDVTTADIDDDAVVYFYTTTTEVPLRIIHMLWRTKDGIETPGHVWESYEYVSLPNKASEGIPLQGWFDRQAGDLAPVWHIWPRADRVDYAHILYVQNEVDDFDVAADDADYPKEWYWALAINLAKLLIPKYGVPYTTAREIHMLAQDAMDDAEGFDTGESVYLQPDDERG